LRWSTNQVLFRTVVLGRPRRVGTATLQPDSGRFPVTIPPTGFIRAVLTEAQRFPGDAAGTHEVWGVAICGDGRVFTSRKIAVKPL
jgi:hypothetical protein